MQKSINEITVKLKWSLDEAKVYFVNKGIPLVESFILKDIYLVKDDVDIDKTANLKILDESVIIRESIGNEIQKSLIYKDKKYDEKENIIENRRYSCVLLDTDDAYEILTKIGFKESFRYEQECLSYAKGNVNILLQYIPELGLFAQLENNKSVEVLINDLNEFDIPYYENEYFVKKASLMLEKIKRKRK